MTIIRLFLAILFAICILICHKTEVRMVILRCLTSPNLDWFNSYGLRCSLRPSASSANSQNIATDKWPFYNHIWPFFANCMCIFHKTEVQTVILRCLNINWYKSYDTKRYKTKNTNDFFYYKIAKNWKWKYLHFVS